MHMLYQDSMAIVRHFGKPDLFITMTCNPKWPEIQEVLAGQSAADRPDLTARVFKLKLKALFNDIKGGALGRPVADIHTIEFQKVGGGMWCGVFSFQNAIQPINPLFSLPLHTARPASCPHFGVARP
jgi:hypothetical protein